MSSKDIIIVGDLHGEWDKLNNLINNKSPKIVFQVGDFGWWPILEKTKSTIKDGVRYSAWKVDGIKSPNSVVYWCDGNHEQYNSADFFNLESRDPYNVYNNVYYMPRGSVLNLPDGRTVMFIGGAESIDKHLRISGYDWFKEELISYSQQNFILDYEGKVDIVISHTCPEEWQPRKKISGKDPDPTRKVLSEVLRKFEPDLWYHGHYHIEKTGRYKNTKYFSLSCPGHDGRWWRYLERH